MDVRRWNGALTGACRPSLRGTRRNAPRAGLLANPVVVARAVPLDVEVPVRGMCRIGAGPQDRGEPATRSCSHGCQNSRFFGVFVFGDRDSLAIGKFEGRDVNRKPDGMGAELATRLIVAVAA